MGGETTGNKADELKGQVKEEFGELIEDRSLQAEGATETMHAQAKQAAHNVTERIEAASEETRPLSMRWWAGGHGLGGFAQLPNPAIAIWAIASVLRWFDVTSTSRSETFLEGIATGALLAWAFDELLRGASPIRRILGAVVLVVLAIRMTRIFV